jgi:hypothetical protein
VDLVYYAAARSAERLGAAAHRARRLFDTGAPASDGDASGRAWFEVENTVTHAARWERDAVSSILAFNGSAPVQTAVEAVRQQLRAQEAALLRALAAEALTLGISADEDIGPTDDRVPARLTRGPLDFGLPESRLSGEAATWYASREFDLSGNERFELVNFIDGTRSVTDIRNALSAEFRPIRLGVVARYLEDLVRVGVVQWHE